MTFVQFARGHGLLIHSLYPSEKIHRCGTEDKPKSKNGAYYFDGERGWVWRWDMGAETIWFEDENAQPWTDDQKKEWIQKRREADRARETEAQKASKKAAEFLDKLTPSTHDYFIRKGLPKVTGPVKDGDLYIPMVNCITAKVMSYQRIFWDGEKWHKKMMYGAPTKNAVFRLGTGNPIHLVEGLATGYSIKDVAPGSVMVCFSANNLVQVASQIGDFVWADNDKSKTGEKAAIETGLPWVMPDEEGWDFNDLRVKKGIFAIKKKLFELNAKARQKPNIVLD
jgi:putative DNA primase/helicase